MRWIAAIVLSCLSTSVSAQAPATPTDALRAVLPAICAGAPQATLASRCAELGAAGAGAFSLAASGQRLEEVPGQARLANRGNDDGLPAPVRREPVEGRAWEAWVAATDGRLDRREGRIEAGFEADRESLVLGATLHPTARWTLDGGWQWLREDLDYTASDGRVRSRLDGPALAAQWAPSDHWTLDAELTHLSGRLDLRRGIRYALDTGVGVAAEARAAPRTRREGLAIALRRHDAFGPWSLGSGLGIERSDTTIAAFRESGGAGWALVLPERRLRSERATIEARLGRAFSARSGVWVPGLRLGLVREFDDPQRTLAVALVDDGTATPIRFLTQEPDRDWAEVSAGLVWVRTGGHSGFVEWRRRLGHRFLDDRQLAVGWRIER